MKKFFAKRRVLIGIVIVILVISQLSIFRPVRDYARKSIMTPIHWLGKTSGKIGTAIRVFGSVNDLAHENSALKAYNDQLLSQLAELQTIKGENDKLKLDLNFKETRPDLTMVPADIVSFSPESGYEVFTINRGEKDGLKIEQAVVANGFLIGKIKNISDHTAEVWQLANRNLLTPVTLAKSRTTGILRGGISGLVVENIPVDAGVEKGESVVTSPLEGLYPSGIAVGVVEEILSKKEEIFLTVRVSSPVNVRSLGTVFVVSLGK
jgi:rod shape-determining protein MreC